MLRLIIAAALSAGAGVANAGSIEAFAPTASTRTSIVEVGCPSCAREAEQKADEEAEVKLAPGEQIVEVREVGGEMMIYRTENWLGGSPVTMVRKATEFDLTAHGVAAPEGSQTAASEKAAATGTEETAGAATEPPLFEPVVANTAPAPREPGIDEDTKTSALGEAQPEPFDPSKYELRLN